MLDEIMVTAQRRVENLRQVPIAATALDAAELQSKAVAQLAICSPRPLALDHRCWADAVREHSRHRTASNSPNATTGVATYVDGLFQPPIVQANSFYDLASVEVLRGPQGTLVGTNSTGGAIFINPRARYSALPRVSRGRPRQLQAA